jgi:hypothetical protein
VLHSVHPLKRLLVDRGFKLPEQGETGVLCSWEGGSCVHGGRGGGGSGTDTLIFRLGLGQQSSYMFCAIEKYLS